MFQNFLFRHFLYFVCAISHYSVQNATTVVIPVLIALFGDLKHLVCDFENFFQVFVECFQIDALDISKYL